MSNLLKTLCTLLLSLPLIMGISGKESITHPYKPDHKVSTASRIDTTNIVKLTNSLNFTPDTLKIQKGQTVTWKNTSLLVHTVTADTGKAAREKSVKLPPDAESFHSGKLQPEETFTHTFNHKGTYTYFCVPHEAAMRGTIIVR